MDVDHFAHISRDQDLVHGESVGGMQDEIRHGFCLESRVRNLHRVCAERQRSGGEIACGVGSQNAYVHATVCVRNRDGGSLDHGSARIRDRPADAARNAALGGCITAGNYKHYCDHQDNNAFRKFAQHDHASLNSWLLGFRPKIHVI